MLHNVCLPWTDQEKSMKEKPPACSYLAALQTQHQVTDFLNRYLSTQTCEGAK